MRFSFILFGVLCFGALATQAQESSGRLSVSPATSPTNATTATLAPQPIAKPPEPTSNVVDAPLPEIANQPKVITPSQTSISDGPKGPRDGHWYIGASAGASLQQFQSEGSVTAIGYPALEVNSNPRIGLVVSGKVGYEFATRDVQLAFGGPIPMKTALEFDMTYFAYRLKQPVTATGGGNVLGYKTGKCRVGSPV